MKSISRLIKKLEQLTCKDCEKIREEIAEICSKFLNEEFGTYQKLDGEIKDLIDELGVMDEIEGRKESKILHMKVEEVKQILKRLKVVIE
tara:strand:+ start:545 stop:814 length:270 start_codon:yes stop_codon:yes gene_type:complete